MATQWLSNQEAQRLWPPLDAAIAACGLQLDQVLSVGLEWGEYLAETQGTAGRRLLHLTRLLRQPDRYVQRFGRWAYDVMVSDCLWHVYRMMGKLDERVYLLTKTS